MGKENLSNNGYKSSLAPTITIETGKGFPHTLINNAQIQRRNARLKNGEGKWSSSLQEELQVIVEDMRKAGFNEANIQKVLQQQYNMLDKLNVLYKRVSK